jgi:ABC-type protease/lipase transport system fused ATPase/permease subunit
MSNVMGNAGGVAIGLAASVQNANSVAIGANSVTDRGNLLSLVDRVIVLTAGAIAFDGSRDAFIRMRAQATAG